VLCEVLVSYKKWKAGLNLQQVRVYSPKGKKHFMQNFEACLVDDAVMHVECRGAAVSISTRYSCYCTWRSNNTRSSRVCARGLIQGEGDFFALNTQVRIVCTSD